MGRGLLGAVVAGVLAAALLWAAGGAPRGADAVAPRDDAGPDAHAVRAATTGRPAPRVRARPGTVRVVARAADPDGGPEWVLERFVRLGGRVPADLGRRGPVACVRLGRLVRGRVSWVDALGRRGTVPVQRQPTICRDDARGGQPRTLVVLDARGGHVRRRLLVTYGLGPQSPRRARLAFHGRSDAIPPGAPGVLRVDRPVAGETPRNAGYVGADRRGPAPLPGRTPRERRAARERRRDVTDDPRHLRVIAQGGTPVGTVGVVVGRMPGTGAACLGAGVTSVFAGVVGDVRGELGVVEVSPVFQCERLSRTPRAKLPLVRDGFLRTRDPTGRLRTVATAAVLAPSGADRIELRTIAGVQTVRVAPPGVAVAVWADSGAGTEDVGPGVGVTALRPDGSRMRSRDGGWTGPPPPAEDLRRAP